MKLDSLTSVSRSGSPVLLAMVLAGYLLLWAAWYVDAIDVDPGDLLGAFALGTLVGILTGLALVARRRGPSRGASDLPEGPGMRRVGGDRNKHKSPHRANAG